MHLLNKKQEQINIERERVIKSYPALWSKIISEWKVDAPEDQAWLVYSANYLFRTAGVRWALDPLRLRQRLPDAPEMDYAIDLKGLSFVLLSHNHKDHLDLALLNLLNTLPIIWVVPEPILDLVQQAGLSLRQIIVPRPLEPFEIAGIRLTGFEGQHFVKDASRPGGLRGVPSTGYLAEFNGKRWLFPGDTRNFDTRRLPDLGAVDGAFVHIWLGKASAQIMPPPMLEPFCQFCAGLRASRLMVTHLRELGRDAEDYWDLEHYRLMEQRMKQFTPEISVKPALMGEAVVL